MEKQSNPSQINITIFKPDDNVAKINTIKIDSGSFKTTYASDSKHPMITGNGRRSITQQIIFNEKFSSPPKVQVNFCKIDADKDNNLRVSCKVLETNNDKFSLEIYTWGHSKLYGATCNWIAYGF